MAAVLFGCDTDAASRTEKQRPAASSHQSSSRQTRQKHSAVKPAAQQEPEVAAGDPESEKWDEKWDEVIARMQPRQCNPDGWCTVYELPPRSGKWLGSIWPKDGQLFVAGGYGAVVHFDGTSWHYYDTPANSMLREIRGSGVNDMYAVGTMLTIVHWDGETWKAELGPKGNPRGNGCWDLRVVASGEVYVTCRSGAKLEAYHRADGKWSKIDEIPETVPDIRRNRIPPPEPLPKECSKPRNAAFAYSDRDTIAVCQFGKIYRAEAGAQCWQRFGREEKRGWFRYFRMGNRWIGTESAYAVFREIDGEKDPYERWTRLPYPKGLRNPSAVFLESDSGPAYFFAKGGEVFVYDGESWKQESTGAKHGVQNAKRLGSAILATSRTRVLVKKLDGGSKESRTSTGDRPSPY